METINVPVDQIDPNPDQPRKSYVEAELCGLGQNMLAHGQLVPVILMLLSAAAGASKALYQLIDGERRWRAAKLVGIKTLVAIVLERIPTAAELLVMQASIDLHRSDHRPSERAATLARILKETGLTLSGLCEKIGISQGYGSKLAALAKLAPEALALVDAGNLSIEKAYSLSQEPDQAKQLAMLGEAKNLSREALRKRVRNGPSAEVKASAVRLAMPGVVVQLRGSDLTIDRCIDVLADAVKQLKKALNQGLDVSTAQAVFKDTAKAVR